MNTGGAIIDTANFVGKKDALRHSTIVS